jgi:hypothetical protein
MTRVEEYLIYKNYNINLYSYTKKTDCYSFEERYQHPNPDNNTTDVNIAVVNIKDRNHIFYVKDVGKATGIIVCPKCHYAVFQNERYNRNNSKHQGSNTSLTEHIKNCDGKVENGKKLVVLKRNIPYCDHITSNKTYKYLLAHNRLNEFKPRRFYITFDLETMEEKNLINIGNSSQILSIIKPLSIDSCVYSSKGEKIVYFDIRDGEDFVEKWVNKIFEEANQIIKDNKYEDPSIPFDNFVPIIGFNSSRFDLNLILKHLHKPEKGIKIKKIIGSLNNFKALIIEKKLLRK